MGVVYRPKGIKFLGGLNLLVGFLLFFVSMVAYLSSKQSPVGSPEGGLAHLVVEKLPIILVMMSFFVILMATGLLRGWGICWWGYTMLLASCLGYLFASLPLMQEYRDLARELGQVSSRVSPSSSPLSTKYIFNTVFSVLILIYLFTSDVLLFFRQNTGIKFLRILCALAAIGGGFVGGTVLQKKLIDTIRSEYAASKPGDVTTNGRFERDEEQASIEGWMFPVTPISFVCSKDVPAYDVERPLVRIGTFKAGTSLEVLAFRENEDVNAESFRVRHVDSTGQIIEAMCNRLDLGNDMPNKTHFRSRTKVSNKQELGRVEALNSMLKDPLFGGRSRVVELTRDVTAYSRTPPHKKVGIFKRGTMLEVGNVDPVSGMTAVALVQNGQLIAAFCNSGDVSDPTPIIIGVPQPQRHFN